MAASDLASLKAYVLGPSSQNKAEDTVVLSVSHSNLKQQFAEIRFDLHTTVERVKERLRSHTGTAVDSMRLELFDQNNSQLAVLSDEWRPLGFYSPGDGYRIHVVDTDPISLSAGGWLEDTTLVKKFELTDEEYNNRADTYRKFKEQKIAQDPSWSLQKELAQRRGDDSPATQPITDEHMAERAGTMKVGDRCEVDPGAKRGQVAYVGCVASLPPGFWIGVHYDEPVGKHDGMVKGEQLFKCPFGHGSFLRPDRVKVGDYAERDPFDDDPDEI